MGRAIKNLRYLSPNQVARYLCVTPRSIYKLIGTGELPAVKVGKVWRVNFQELEAFVERNRNGPKPAPERKTKGLTKREREEAERIMNELL